MLQAFGEQCLVGLPDVLDDAVHQVERREALPGHALQENTTHGVGKRHLSANSVPAELVAAAAVGARQKNDDSSSQPTNLVQVLFNDRHDGLRVLLVVLSQHGERVDSSLVWACELLQLVLVSLDEGLLCHGYAFKRW